MQQAHNNINTHYHIKHKTQMQSRGYHNAIILYKMQSKVLLEF